MKAIIPKYNSSGSKIVGTQEVEVLGTVRFQGDDNYAFKNDKIYKIIGIQGYLLRIIDESEEDYLYAFECPTLNIESVKGKFELIEDYTKDKILTKRYKK